MPFHLTLLVKVSSHFDAFPLHIHIFLFLGNYGGANILLDQNTLTDFEWEVFLEALDEMNRTNSGLVSIAGSKNLD